MKVYFILFVFYTISTIFDPRFIDSWSGSPLGKIVAVILYGRSQSAWHFGREREDHHAHEEPGKEGHSHEELPEGEGNALVETFRILRWAHYSDPTLYGPIADLTYLYIDRMNQPEVGRDLILKSYPQIENPTNRARLLISLFLVSHQKLKDEVNMQKSLLELKEIDRLHGNQLEPGVKEMVHDLTKKYSSGNGKSLRKA